MNVFIFTVLFCAGTVVVDGRVLLYVHEELNYSDAEATCQSQGLEIPIFPRFHSFQQFVQQVADFRARYSSSYPGRKLWLGMFHDGSDEAYMKLSQSYRWSDGSPVGWDSMPWSDNEPDYVDGQPCMRTNELGQLFTTPCDWPRAFFCSSEGAIGGPVIRTNPKWYRKTEALQGEYRLWKFTDCAFTEENDFVGLPTGNDVIVNDVTDCLARCMDNSGCWYIRVEELSASTELLCGFFDNL